MYEDGNIKPSDTSINILDIWILSLLNRLKKTVTESMDKYELDSATRPINDFIDDLSTWYLRRSRERMKGDFGEKEKELAVSTLAFVLSDFAKLIAPFMPFVAERIYLEIDPQKESVHLEKWPEFGNIDEINLVQMREIRDIVSAGLEARIKANIKVRQPLNSLTIKEVDGFSASYLNLLKEELNVKNIFENSAQTEKVVLDLEITPELKKEGDLRELSRAIKDIRKEKGLTQKDEVVLLFAGDDAVISFMKESKDFLQKECSLSDLVLEDGLQNSFKIGDMSIAMSLK
jgi:isoleucyl-tRNA synthetase